MIKLSHILLNPKKAKRHPAEMLLVGFFYASLSLFISLWLFPDYASISAIFLTVLSSLYIIQGAIINDESKEKDSKSEKTLLKEHSKTLLLFLYLFLGFLIAFMFWKLTLPDTTASILYELQESEIQNLRAITGNAISNNNFTIILGNNLKVLFISLLFALFYGAGAIFILAWNASIMGFVIGELTRNTLGFAALPLIVFKYFLHGIPEMIAYFIAALAGGILFVTIVRGDFSKLRIKKTLFDVGTLILISLIILVGAALIETFISPLI